MEAVRYILIIKIFMVIMPVCFGALAWFVGHCIKHHKTDQPAFWYGLFYMGILFSEILRGIFILKGSLPAHPKEPLLWVSQHIPLGAFLYELGKKYVHKVWSFFLNSR